MFSKQARLKKVQHLAELFFCVVLFGGPSVSISSTLPFSHFKHFWFGVVWWPLVVWCGHHCLLLAACALYYIVLHYDPCLPLHWPCLANFGWVRFGLLSSWVSGGAFAPPVCSSLSGLRARSVAAPLRACSLGVNVWPIRRTATEKKRQRRGPVNGQRL